MRSGSTIAATIIVTAIRTPTAGSSRRARRSQNRPSRTWPPRRYSLSSSEVIR